MRRHYADMAALGATDQWLAEHYLEHGRREGRIAQRLRVVASFEAASGLDVEGSAYDSLSVQIYGLVETLAVATLMGAEVVRRWEWLGVGSTLGTAAEQLGLCRSRCHAVERVVCSLWLT